MKNHLLKFKISLFLLTIFSLNRVNAQTYCWPDVQMACFYGDKITRVTFAGIDHTDANCSDDADGRKDFTSTVSPAQVIAGSTYSISVAVENNLSFGTERVRIWIDFNRDYVFQANESFDLGAGTGNTTLTNSSIFIPADAQNGITRMRVMYRRTSTNALTPEDACHSYGSFRGQAKDYVVNIATTGAVTCETPTSFAASEISTTSATLGWNAPNPAPANDYEYVISQVNATPSGNGSNESGLNVNLNNLNPATHYFVFVRAICSELSQSNWVTTDFFTSELPCASLTNLLASITGSTSATVAWSPANPAPANGYEYVMSQNANLPLGAGIPVPSGSSVILNGLTPENTYYVFVRSICTTENSSDWTMVEFTTPLTPPCFAPTGLVVGAITTNSGMINWTLPFSGEPITYYWEAYNTGTPGNGTSIATGWVFHPLTYCALSGLSPNTGYTVFMRTRCAEDSSNWVESNKFFTTSVGIENLERFESGLQLFPNPVINQMNIMLPDEPKVNLIIVEITDLSGRSVLINSFTFQNPLSLNLEQFNAGIYLIRILTGDKIFLQKFFKE